MTFRHVLVLAFLCACTTSFAAVPQSLNYQAYLSDSSGAPVDGLISVTFAIYTVETGGSALWSETRTIDTQSGLFSVELGALTAFPAGLFDTPLWIGVAVEGDPEMTPRRALTTAAFSFKADDALSLQGQSAASFATADDLTLLQSNSVLALDELLTPGQNNEVNVAGRANFNAPGTPQLSLADPSSSQSPWSMWAQGDADGTLLIHDDLNDFTNPKLSLDKNGRMKLRGRIEALVSGTPQLLLAEPGGVHPPWYMWARGASGELQIHNDFNDWSNPGLRLDRFGQIFSRNRINAIVDNSPQLQLGTGTASWWFMAFNDGSLRVFDNFNNPADSTLVIDAQKRVGIGTTTPATMLDVNGAITIRGGADIVEGFDTNSGDLVEPGSVMVIDADHPGKLRTSDIAYDAKVAGVVSGAGGVMPGIKLGQDGVLDGDVPMAMSGRVYVKCSTENGPIRPGDRLTTSSLSGHAMRATDTARAPGSVIGKAMSELDDGTGLVLVLVNLQ